MTHGASRETYSKEEKTMKKLIALLLALAMVLGLVACGAKAPAEAPLLCHQSEAYTAHNPAYASSD